ncbi:MAG: hypothetical protein JST10_00325 [Bacteroidetes bacterium]|nr:hypothetical protein [Bacteroidota bacterium]MBS1630996.1 hypothetical protein [Bacteroidota bacterium]
MKRLLIILVSMAVSIGASSQHGKTSYIKYPRPRSHVVIVRPVYYPPYYYGYYTPLYYPFRPVYRYPGETRLEIKIDSIRNDYRDKIWSARHDKSLSRSQRKETIHQLKHDRDLAINQAEAGYYKNS